MRKKILLLLTVIFILSSILEGEEINSLSQIFLPGKGVADSDGDNLPDQVSMCIVLPDEPHSSQLALASDIAARANLESLITNFSLVKRESGIKNKKKLKHPILIGSNLKWIKRLENSGKINLPLLKEHQGMVTFFSDNNQRGLVVVAGSEKALLQTGRAFFLRWPYLWEIWGRKEGDTYLKVEKDLKEFLKEAGINSVEVSIKKALYEFPPLQSPHDTLQRLDFNRGEIKNLSIEIITPTSIQKEKALNALKNLQKEHQRGKRTDTLSYSGCRELTFKLRTRSEVSTVSISRMGYPQRYLTPSYKSPLKKKIKGKNFDLLNFFSTQGAYSDLNQDRIADDLDSTVVIPESLKTPSLPKLTSRLTLNTAGSSFPIVYLDKEIEEKETKQFLVSPIIIGRTNILNKQLIKTGKLKIPPLKEGSGIVQVVPEAFNGSNALSLVGADEKGIEKTLSYLSQTFPYLKEYRKGTPRIQDVSTALKEFFKGKRGSAEAYFHHRLEQTIQDIKIKEFEEFQVKLNLPQENRKYTKEVKYLLTTYLQTQKLDINSSALRESKTIWKKERKFSWEGDEALKLIEEKLNELKSLHKPLKIRVGVSEPPSVRKKLKEKIKNILSSQNLAYDEVKVLCAYKQGFFWIKEQILPLLKKEKIHHLTIRFAQEKEDFSQLKRFYSEPVRWLQELYPVDEIIARETNIPLKRIHFQMKEEPKPVYEILAYDEDDNLVFDNHFTPYTREILYIKELPEWGKVKVTTGWVKIETPEKILLQKTLKTDLEKFWLYYQQKIIPQLKAYIFKKTENQPSFEKQPYFKRLKVEMWFSEPDYKLGIDEEIISSLESIHDEIYFDTLDFLRGITEVELEDEKILEDTSRYSAPGKILPLIHPSSGGKPGRVKITLEDWKAQSPQLIIRWKEKDKEKKEEKINFPPIKPQKVRWKSFIYNGLQEKIENLIAQVELEKKENYLNLIESIHAYKELCKKDILSSPFSFPSLKALTLNIKWKDLEKKEVLPVSYQSPSPKKSSNLSVSEEWTVPTHEIISPSMCLDIVNKLDRFKTIHSYIAGHSYEERKIPVLEIFTPLHPYTSLPRLITFKPTLYASGRQHANEVSSTNYLLKFAELVARNHEYKNFIKKVNLVLHPLENPDGAALAYKLQQITPFHSLHAGRYSSLGIDVGYQVYSPQPILPEAKVRKNLYDQWLPDIYLNLHGYPSHEWVQMFSNYSPYLFRSYWIPRGWFTYYRDVNLPIYQKWKKASQDLREFLIKELNTHEKLKSSNQKFYDRYYRWAARWQPHLNRLEIHKGVNIYAQRKSSTARRLTSRRKITFVEETPEVMDETAHGTWLDFLCLQGLAYLKAHVKYLSQVDYKINRIEEETRNRIRIQFLRSRPGELK